MITSRAQAVMFVLLGAAVLVSLASWRTVSLAGDPFAVYFPVAENLLRGHGLKSFTPLWLGPGRHPGYPMLLAIAALFAGDLIRSAQIIDVLSAAAVLGLVAYCLLELGARSRVVAASILILCSAPVFVRSSLEALPDMACMAVILAAIVYLSIEEVSRRNALLAGLAMGITVLIRPNAPVLLPAAVIAIVARSRALAVPRVAFFLGGFLLGFSPFLAPVLELNSLGMKYPLAATRGLLQIEAGESLPAALVRLTWRGVLALPERLAMTTTWPVLALGLPLLLYSAFVRRHPLAISAVVFSGLLAAGLLPFHYEDRYYLFALVALVPAALLAIENIVERFRVPAWLGWLTWAAFTAGVSIFGGRAAMQTLISEQQVGLELEEVCAELAALAPRPGATVLIGAGPGLYTYSRFRECPRPARAVSNILLTDALPGDLGLDGFFGAAGTELPPGERVRTVVSQTLVKFDAPAARTATTAPILVSSGPWNLEMPRGPGKTCETRTLSADPGDYSLEAVFHTDRPLVGRLSVTSGGTTKHLVGAGFDRPPVSVDLSVGQDRTLELRFCVSDPIRAPGLVLITRLALFRR